MFDLGWAELMVIGVVALIVVGPKDLPVLFRRAGEFVGKARAMAGEFTRAMNDAADDTGLRDIERTVRGAADPKGFGLDELRDNFRATGPVVRPARPTTAVVEPIGPREPPEALSAEELASEPDVSDEPSGPGAKTPEMDG